MTSFPVFVPMFWSGGGGGRGPLKPKDLLIIVGLLGAVYGGLKYTFDYPRFKMRMNRGYRIRNDEIYIDLIHTNKYPKIMSVQHTGLDCMKKKGYKIKVDNITDDVGYRRLSYNQLMKAEIMKENDNNFEDIDGDEFFRTCKECGVTTEIKFMDTSVMSNNHSYGKRDFKWHRCSLPELK